MTVRILSGDSRAVLSGLPAGSVQMCVTSPPYWRLRRYLPEDHPLAPFEIGWEETPEAYVEQLVATFREVARVLRPDGTLWVDIGDKYAGIGSGGGGSFGAERGKTSWLSMTKQKGYRRIPNGLKPKDLIGLPWMLAFALRADGWYLRAEIIWSKTNPSPEQALDRPARAHENLFLFSRAESYFYDAEAVREPVTSGAHPRGTGTPPKARVAPSGARDNASHVAATRELVERRNLRSVWSIAGEPYRNAHFATMPRRLVRPCILAGTSETGCCSGCGAPFVREVERRKMRDGKPDATYVPRNDHRDGKRGERHEERVASGSSGNRITVATRTVGWKASCVCPPAAPVPCTVLDPFGGSGTVGEEATTLGRHAVLIDLHPGYEQLAKERTAQQGLYA